MGTTDPAGSVSPDPVVQGIGGAGVQEWYLPTAALNRFRLPKGTAFVQAGPAREEVRYGFRVGPLGLLIKPRTGSEVVPMVPIASIPISPPWLLGMINLRSTLVPVFDLKLICALDDADRQGEPMVLVLDKGDMAVGTVIDGYPKAVSAMNRIPRLPQLPTALRGYVSAGYLRDEELWLEFDHARFFASLGETAGSGRV